MKLDIRPEYKGCSISAYDKEAEVGINYYTGPLLKETVLNIDAGVECDWVFNGSGKKVVVGDYVVCDLGGLEDIVPFLKNNVFLFTGFCWVYLENKCTYDLLVEGLKKRVFIGTEFNVGDLLENTCLSSCLTETGINELSAGLVGNFTSVNICYARCKPSMYLLDDLHRNFIQENSYEKGSVVVVKAGAGSGKTTTQLRLCSRFSNKRILYLAFNKSLVQEIEGKLLSRGIHNMTTLTFDALLRRAFIKVKGFAPEISDLKPQTIGGLIPWLQGKSRKLKSYYCKNFSKFCSDVRYTDMKEFCKTVLGKEVKILEELWAKVVDGSLITFDAIRKLSFNGHWFKQYIDKEYDMIFVDEIQDFDMAMLRMLLDDTTVAKLFVGDPRQSIYEWRGCINAFDYMPKSALLVEFYSTFRVGEPALSEICKRFKDCYMISKAKHETRFGYIEEGDKYVYLFRSWRQLLTTARETHGMWIYGFEQKIIQMRNLHEKLQGIKDVDDMEFEDDLPSFLLSMSSEELNELICDIARNLVSKDESRIKFYTIHSYKGMEDDIIRIADDVNIVEEPNLYYVALTRGMQKVCEDDGRVPKGVLEGKKENSILDMLMGIVPLKKKEEKTLEKEGKEEKSEALKISGDAAPKSKKVGLWSLEEEDKLLRLVGEGTSFEQVAIVLDRSVLAVEFRLRKIGAEKILGGLSMTETMSICKLDRLSLEEAVDSERVRLANIAKKKSVGKDKVVKWDERELNKLLGLIKTGTPLNKIAIMCGRGLDSIKEKLFEQAGKYGVLGLAVDEIIKITGLSAIEVNTAFVAAKRLADI